MTRIAGEEYLKCRKRREKNKLNEIKDERLLGDKEK